MSSTSALRPTSSSVRPSRPAAGLPHNDLSVCMVYIHAHVLVRSSHSARLGSHPLGRSQRCQLRLRGEPRRRRCAAMRLGDVLAAVAAVVSARDALDLWVKVVGAGQYALEDATAASGAAVRQATRRVGKGKPVGSIPMGTAGWRAGSRRWSCSPMPHHHLGACMCGPALPCAA